MELMTDGEGILWIRPQSANLFYYLNGKFQDVINEVNPARSPITAMSRTANGQGLFSDYLGVWKHIAVENFLKSFPRHAPPLSSH